MAHFLFLNSSDATSFYIRPFSEFTQTTETIVHGTLSNIHTENGLTGDGGKTIYTYANLAIKEVLKGKINSNQILIRKIGGSKDGLTLEIPSSPELIEGEETVLYLSSEKEDHAYEITGLELGKFGLQEKNGELILTGGIFNYGNKNDAHPGETLNNEDPNLKENSQEWSINQLKSMIAKQAPALESVKENLQSPSLTNSSVSISKTELPQQSTAKESTLEKNSAPDSEPPSPFLLPLFIAFIILGMGLIFYFRKR